MAIKENAEESNESVYYDFLVSSINTRACIAFNETGQNIRRAWMSRAYFNKEKVALLESDAWCENNSFASINLAVGDNGPDGDGLQLTAALTNTGNTFADEDGGEIFSISLAPRQAKALAEALLSAVRMRAD